MNNNLVEEKHYRLFEHLENFLMNHDRDVYNHGYCWFVTTKNCFKDETNYTRFNFFRSPKGDLDGLELCLGVDTDPDLQHLLELWKSEYLKSK